MAKRIEVKTELTAEELHERYRQTKDAVERTHWHILWQVKEGKTPREVAEVLGYTARWVRTIIGRWNSQGEAGIRDHRHEIDVSKPLLSAEQQEELAKALQGPPEDGGLWSGPKVAQWMGRTLGREIAPQRGWDYLQRMGYSSRVPRPQHAKADKELQQAFKKLPEQVEAVQAAHRHKSVELWSMDEHRIGLKPILRRIWAPKGATVVAPVAPRYQWMYVFAFVHPESGNTSWLLLPSVNTEVFSQALELFAKEVGAGADKQIVLVLDGAGWHTSAALVLPPGIQLLFLPPYSPEVQPAERLWPLSNEPVANRVFTSLDELEQVQAERCRWLQDHPAVVQAHTCFHWWPSLDST